VAYLYLELGSHLLVLLEDVFVELLGVSVGVDLSSEVGSETVVGLLDHILAVVELVHNTEGSTGNVHSTVGLADSGDPLSENLFNTCRDGVDVVDTNDGGLVNDLAQEVEAGKEASFLNLTHQAVNSHHLQDLVNVDDVLALVVHFNQQLVDSLADGQAQIGLLFEGSNINFFNELSVGLGRSVAEFKHFAMEFLKELSLVVVQSGQTFKSILFALKVHLSLVGRSEVLVTSIRASSILEVV